MYKIKHILLIIVGLLLVSCASNRPNRVHKQVMTQRTQVTLTFDQHEYKTNCMLKVWKNELIVLSVMPVMGTYDINRPQTMQLHPHQYQHELP